MYFHFKPIGNRTYEVTMPRDGARYSFTPQDNESINVNLHELGRGATKRQVKYLLGHVGTPGFKVYAISDRRCRCFYRFEALHQPLNQ